MCCTLGLADIAGPAIGLIETTLSHSQKNSSSHLCAHLHPRIAEYLTCDHLTPPIGKSHQEEGSRHQYTISC